MTGTERDFIALCIKKLEQKFSFGKGHGYTEKDLESLSNYIEDEKGVYLSLSTLKRVWKNNFKNGPQLATLNALASALDYESWQEFKLKNRDNIEIQDKVADEVLTKEVPRIALVKRVVAIMSILVLGGLFWILITGNNKGQSSVSVNGPVKFEANKTMVKGVPNTIIFHYDLSNVTADSFFIQQSWNKWRRDRIDPGQHVFSSIYHESGFHRAKLIANDSTIAELPLHILSNAWEPHIYYKSSDDQYFDFKGMTFTGSGMLYLPNDRIVKSGVDTSRYFLMRVDHSRNYGVSSDNFFYTARVRIDKKMNINCPWINVLLITEKNSFNIELVRKGCELHASYSIGEIRKNGKDSDLSLLGCELYNWQDVVVQVKNKRAVISLNQTMVYEEKFEQDFGKIMGLAFIFSGNGYIDYVKLADLQNKNVFEDSFD